MSKLLSRLNIGNSTLYTKVRPGTKAANITPITRGKLLVFQEFSKWGIKYPQGGYYKSRCEELIPGS